MLTTSVRWLGGLLLAAVVFLMGCSGDGPALGTVTGTVQVDGKAASTGSIAFIPADGKSPTAGAVITAGKYEAKVPLGIANVEIRVSKIVGKVKIYDTPDSPIQDKMEEALPKRYHDESTLTYEVKSGSNTKDWDLKTR